MITDLFKTRRRITAERDLYRNLTIKQTDEIADLREAAEERAEEAETRIAELQESLRLAHRAMDTQRRLRINAEEHMATVVEELRKLREEIAAAERAERAEDEAKAWLPVRGFGMARPLDRPLVWQTADAIAQDAAAKRLADGAGDDL